MNKNMKQAFKEDRLNLRTVAIILLLVDIFLFPMFFGLGLYEDYLFLLLYESSIILGLMIGIRGQGRYRAMMLDLRAIAANKDFDADERDARIVPLIHHCCLELGISAEMRNEEYGLHKKKVLKKTKNIGGKK